VLCVCQEGGGEKEKSEKENKKEKEGKKRTLLFVARFCIKQ
jgi:hypothetical protein